MRRVAVVLVGVLVALSLGCAEIPVDAADAGLPDAAPLDAGGAPADFDGFVEWQMRAGGIPGAALAIVTPEGVTRIAGYGFADIEADRAVDEHTLFIMASISKTFAVVRAMQLVEQGDLDLDAPIGDYLGYTVQHPEHPRSPITTRALLTHSSGLEDNFSSLLEVTGSGDPTMTLDQFTRAYALEGGSLYADDHWGRTPGTRRSYCNAGFGLVGAVLEAAGGRDLPTQSEESLFGPLALDGAGWFLADVDPTRLAVPYAYNGRSFGPLPHGGFAYYPASSLRISAAGLARFARFILRGGELDGVRALSERGTEQMLEAQIPDLDPGQAIGFSERRVAGVTFIGHGGSTSGGSTQLLLARDNTFALLLITNSDAYLRARVIRANEGRDAIDAILERMVHEATAP